MRSRRPSASCSGWANSTSPAGLRRFSRADDPPPDPDRVVLVLGEVVGEAADPGVHLGAAERLVVGLLAGRHLHQRRAAEEDLRAAADEHRVVAHAGDVRPTGGRVAEDQRDRRLLAGGRAGEVAEEPAAGDEDLLLRRQVGAAGLDERDRREVVLLGDLRGPEGLLHRPGVGGAALHRRVVGADHALDALDHADAGHERRTDGEVGAPARQRRQLEEGRPGVDEQLDPLARRQLAARVVAVDVLLATPGHRDRVLRVEVGELLEHRLAVGSRSPPPPSSAPASSACRCGWCARAGRRATVQ